MQGARPVYNESPSLYETAVGFLNDEKTSGIRVSCSCDGGAHGALLFRGRLHKGSGAKLGNPGELFV